MAKTKKSGSMIGLLGATMIGAAILLFVVSITLSNLKASADPGGCRGPYTSDTVNTSINASRAQWTAFNTSVDSVQTILNVCVILMAVMGIVIVGSQIIGYIGGAFGG